MRFVLPLCDPLKNPSCRKPRQLDGQHHHNQLTIILCPPQTNTQNHHLMGPHRVSLHGFPSCFSMLDAPLYSPRCWTLPPTELPGFVGSAEWPGKWVTNIVTIDPKLIIIGVAVSGKLRVFTSFCVTILTFPKGRLPKHFEP